MLSHRLRLTAVLLLTGAVFTVNGLTGFLFTARLAGRDLVGNYAFAWLMKQQLLHGTLFGWSQQWLLGFPTFSFYPPLFFVVTAAADIATLNLIGLQSWFLIIVFLSVFLLPAVTYLTTRSIFSDTEAVIASIYMLYFLLVYPPVSQTYQVLSVGLVAQGFAFLLLIPAITAVLRHRLLLAALFLAATTLAHPFVGIVGLIAATAHTVFTRDVRVAAAAMLALLLTTPWILSAARIAPYLPAYTFEPARIGGFILLLLPLILLGGYRTTQHRTLLATFAILLLIGTVELPLITQEFRFFTYALGIGSLLAGLGAYTTYHYLSQHGYHRDLLLLVLLLPVLGLSFHADTVPMWAAEQNDEALYQQLENQPQGRVLVETTSTIRNAYVHQALIPIQTRHWAVNELHLDSSPSANYLLTAEHWVSADALPNPICSTCNQSTPPDAVVDARLDDLGIRYVLRKTPGSPPGNLSRLLSVDRYTVFENLDGHDLVEPVAKPVALHGSFAAWNTVNDDLLFTNISRPIVWLNQPPMDQDRFAAVIPIDDARPEQVLQQVAAAPRDPVRPANVTVTVTSNMIRIDTNTTRPVPVHVKVSYLPTHHVDAPLYAARFNTMLVSAANTTRIRLR